MLRPLPHRGDVVAAGAVALAALVALLQVRFDDAWGKGIHFVYSAAALAFVGTLALRAPREGDAPRAYESALLAVTFALAVPTLARLSLLLGSDGLDSSGTLAWAGGALAALGFGLGDRARLGAVRAAGRGQPRPRRPGLRRPRLLARGRADLPLAAARARRRSSRSRPSRRRDHHPARAVAFADAGGLAALALALTFVVDQVFGSSPLFGPGAGTGWELFLYACGFGLCAFSAVDRAPGPGMDRRRGPAGHHRRRRRRQGHADRLAARAGRRRRRAARHRPAPEPAAAARPLARRGPRLRDQERAVSDLHAGAGPRPGRRPRAPPRQGRASRASCPCASASRGCSTTARSPRRRCWPTGSGDGLGADGVVTGLGRIAGRPVAVMANDPTVKAGSWGPKTVEKIIRIQERALSLRVPMVYLVDSAGARITEQVQMFPGRRGAGRIFHTEVKLLGRRAAGLRALRPVARRAAPTSPPSATS